MFLIEKYLGYWPVIVGSAAFLVIGLLLWLVAERGLERSRKPLSWVREYRRPGFPLRAEALACRRVGVWDVLPAVLFALAVCVGMRVAAGFSIAGGWAKLLLSRYFLFNTLASAAGAVSKCMS